MQGGGQRRRRSSHRARALAMHRDEHTRLCPLPVLALLIGVHVKTLRSAARDGRLPVIYDTRTTFRRLRARATPAAARAFRRSYYGRPVKLVDRRAPLTWASVPDDYDVRIRALRRARGWSQAQLATLVGAARSPSRRLPMGGAETHAWDHRCSGNESPRVLTASAGATVSGLAPGWRDLRARGAECIHGARPHDG